MPNSGVMRGPAVLTFFSALVLVVFSSGCVVSVEEPQGVKGSAQRTAVSASAAPLPQYDVAISAIDFDPPIGREVVLSSPRSPSFTIKVSVDSPQLDPSLPKPSRELLIKVSDQ